MRTPDYRPLHRVGLSPPYVLNALIAALAMASLGTSAGVLRQCSLPDTDIVYCPVFQAPRTTELRKGFTVFEYTVRTDGSVRDVRVVESGGDGRWIKAATEWIMQRRYRRSDHEVRKSERFGFSIVDTKPIID